MQNVKLLIYSVFLLPLFLRVGYGQEYSQSSVEISEADRAVEWKSDLTNVSIPDINAQGVIHNQKFQCEKVVLEGEILKLRQGEGFFADLELIIFLFPKGNETIESNTFEVGKESKFRNPHIHMKWKEEGDEAPKTEIFMKDYVMHLEFGSKSEGKLPGKIYICLPDEEKKCGCWKV